MGRGEGGEVAVPGNHHNSLTAFHDSISIDKEDKQQACNLTPFQRNECMSSCLGTGLPGWFHIGCGALAPLSYRLP